MKTLLVADLWGMIIGWCLYLNGYTMIASAEVFLMALIALIRLGEVNYQRMAMVSIGSYVALFGLYVTSDISYFFSALHVFLAIQALNSAIMNEYLWQTDRNFVLAILSMILLGMAFISVLIILVNDIDYSIFTKRNLFLMEAFIFLPYLFPCAYCFLKQAMRPVVHKQGATM